MSDTQQEFLSDDQILDHSQVMRKKIIDDMTVNGSKIPDDKGDKFVLLQALKDMDKQVIDKKKVAIDSKAADNATVVAKMAAKVMELAGGGANPFKREGAGTIPVVEQDKLPEYTPVPGETEVGIISDSYDSFMGVHGKKNQSSDAGI